MTLHVSAVPDECWSHREVLESCQFPVHVGIPKKFVLTPAKAWLSRMDGLASENEGNPANSKNFYFLHVLLCGLPQEGVARILGGSYDLRGFRFRVGLPSQMIQTRKIPHRGAQKLGI